MPPFKKTKIELKTQRDALGRFERFLPMLQLKKQQLQAEMQVIQQAMDQVRAEDDALRAAARSWTALFPEGAEALKTLVTTDKIDIGDANIAGVTIPVFGSIAFRPSELDLFDTPPWLDDARELVKKLAENRVRRRVLERQHELLGDELRTTSQRVNLFEKVKIPECREKIRVIKIFLGDLMTAEVSRGKAAKKVGLREDAA